MGRGRDLLARTPAPGWMMLALAAGFVAGVMAREATAVLDAAQLVGGIWLDGLRMTIVPLVFALVATGVASLRMGGEGEARRIGRGLPLILVGLLVLSAVVAAILAPLQLGMFTIAPETTAALPATFPVGPAPVVPSTGVAVRAIPANVVASAAEGAIVPLVIFALILGLAVGRIDPARAESVLRPLRGLADAASASPGASPLRPP
jgi:Na+/H+-dicarboxylate symporter